MRANHPPRAFARVLVLIHGYNNTEDDADASYAAFDDVFDPRARAFWPVAHFFWPGDKPWGALSRASYPMEIGAARDAARELATFLAALTGPHGTRPSVAFVAHSLGCRLLLELLHIATTSLQRLDVPVACLMAAAVPVTRVDVNGALRAAAQSPRRAIVMHSPDDAVLKWAFRLGQLAAGEGFASRAVGRFGEPRRGLWAVSMPTRHGHGDYWPSRDCADEVARQLGATPAREVAPRPLLRRRLPREILPGRISGSSGYRNSTG